MTELSVVIVSYNTAGLLDECLRSVQTECAGSETEVIVVDNASADGSAAMVTERHPWVTLIALEDNVGFGRACNLAVASSAGTYVVLLNPDTVVHDRALLRLLDFARQHPDLGVYGGRTLRPDGTVHLSSCWAQQSLWSLLCYSAGLTTLLPGSRLFDPEAMGDWPRDSVRQVDIVTGCLLLTSRLVWDELGGFDDRYFMYGEDADLCLRAARAGYRPTITPDATITHVIGASSPSPAWKRRLMLTGKVTLIDSYWSPGRARLGRFLLQAGVALRAAVSRLTGRSSPWVEVWAARDEWRHGWPAPAPAAA